MPEWSAIEMHDTPEGALVPVLVQPRASRDQVAGVHDGRLKLQLTAPPVEGAANEACTRFLAKLFDVPRARVVLKQGKSDRRKLFLIEGRTTAELLQRLG